MKKADLIKFINVEASSEEQEKVFEWLGSSPRNREYFELLKTFWILPALPEERAPEAEFLKFKSRFKIRGKSKGMKRYSIIFASVAAVVALFFILASYFSGQGVAGKELILISNTGENVMYYGLPDGSRIALFPEAEISYHPGFLQKRSVALKGKAFFEVAADRAHPFCVRVSDVDIRVTGTKFLVMENPVKKTDNKLEVFLEEGSISARLDKSREEIEMVPGDMLVLDKNMQMRKFPQMEVPDEMNVLDGYLRFENVEMNEVLHKLGAYYGVSFVIEGEDLGKLLFTGDLNDKNLESCLKLFSYTMGIQCVVNDTIIKLH